MQTIQVTLRDKTVVTVREPGMAEIGLYLAALPALSSLKATADAMQQCLAGVLVPVPDIPPQHLASLFRLLAVLTGLGDDELRRLGLTDGMALLTALNTLQAENFTPGTSVTPSSSMA